MHGWFVLQEQTKSVPKCRSDPASGPWVRNIISKVSEGSLTRVTESQNIDQMKILGHELEGASSHEVSDEQVYNLHVIRVSLTSSI